MSISWISLIVAVALLLFGQRLYWLFVGGVGFLVGMDLSTIWLHSQPDWVILVCALVAGIVSALVTILFQRIAVGLAAFVAGGHFASLLLQSTFTNTSEAAHIVAFLVAGLIACILALALLDWALIVLSALFGAAIIANGTGQEQMLQVVIFLVLLITGITFQASMRGRRLS